MLSSELRRTLMGGDCDAVELVVVSLGLWSSASEEVLTVRAFG